MGRIRPSNQLFRHICAKVEYVLKTRIRLTFKVYVEIVQMGGWTGPGWTRYQTRRRNLLRATFIHVVVALV